MSGSEATEEDPFIANDSSLSAVDAEIEKSVGSKNSEETADVNDGDAKKDPDAIESTNSLFEVSMEDAEKEEKPAESTEGEEEGKPIQDENEKSPMNLIHNKNKGNRRPPVQKKKLFTAADLKNALKMSDDDKEQKKSEDSEKKTSKLNEGDADTESSELILPSKFKAEKEKEKRKTSVIKNVDATSTEASNASYNSDSESAASPLPLRTSSLKDPASVFEDMIMRQVEYLLADVKVSFLNEFRVLVDEACGIDRAIDKCISEMVREMRGLVRKENFEVDKPEIDVASLFEQLSGVVPKSPSIPVEASGEGSLGRFKTDSSRFIDQAGTFVSEMTSVRAQIMETRMKTTEAAPSRKSEKNVLGDLEIRKMEIDWERQHLEKLTSEMRIKVIEERERNIMLIKDTDSETGEPMHSQMESIIKDLEPHKRRGPVTQMNNFVSKGKSSADEIVLRIRQLWTKVGRFAKVMSIIESHPDPMLTPMELPMESPISTSMQSPVVMRPPVQAPMLEPLVPIPGQSMVANVQARLTEIRKRRAERMRGVRQITAEITSDI